MNPRAPRVSVVMPVHNAERYVAEAIESVLKQTFADYEFIAVDDGSQDGTPAILDRYRTDSRVIVLSPGKVGFVAALNLGLARARGDYVARMDADDICLKRRFERQVNFLDANPDVAACGTATEVFYEHGAHMLGFPRTPDSIRAHLFFHAPLSHPTVMLRREVVQQAHVEYRDAFGGTADYDLWCQLDRAGLRMANLPEVLLRYRRHAAQITTADGQAQVALADRIRREHLSHYGVQPTAEEFTIHSSLARWVYRDLAGVLPQTAAWLNQLDDQLRARGLPPSALRALLAGQWYATCLQNGSLGWPVIRMYLRSRFARVQPYRILRLTASTVLRSLLA